MPPGLVGLAEIAELAGVAKQTADYWTKKDSFPAPVAALAMGKVWEEAAVKRWLERKAQSV